VRRRTSLWALELVASEVMAEEEESSAGR